MGLPLPAAVGAAVGAGRAAAIVVGWAAAAAAAGGVNVSGRRVVIGGRARRWKSNTSGYVRGVIKRRQHY